MDAYESFHEILLNLFHEIMEMEQRAMITEEFKDISNNDMHIIEVIGNGEPKNMSTVARGLKVTVGTLTIAINNLVKKGYVDRVRSMNDRRVVLISLSNKGLMAYAHHQSFRKNMIEATLNGLSAEESKILVKALVNLRNYFEQYES